MQRSNTNFPTASRILCLVSMLALSACGGSGGDSAPSAGLPTPTPTPTPTQAGTSFVAGANARYAILYATGLESGSTYGALGPDDLQGADDAYRQIADYSAGADVTLADVAGDADYAIGSWVGGTFTHPTGPEKTQTEINGVTSYAIYNPATTLPSSASPTCTPHLTAARSNAAVGTVTGLATLSIASATA